MADWRSCGGPRSAASVARAVDRVVSVDETSQSVPGAEGSRSLTSTQPPDVALPDSSKTFTCRRAAPPPSTRRNVNRASFEATTPLGASAVYRGADGLVTWTQA